MAQMLGRSFVFKLIAGSAGQQLGPKWKELESTLAIPKFEFGIIAGGQRNFRMFSNYFLSGQDDFTVSVDETKLSGATDFLVRPLLHGTMMRNTGTLEATLRFLEQGYFVSEADRRPLA